ncbi:type II toxin-antitoxin system Phd/YefM family antitoxin [Nostoc sp. B(2019)]|nr:type II toxin-antitoxin system Phd/YefM family antitoxin [Nostoc sp. B(2019)]
MQKVTVDEIQQDPLKYLNQVEAGETFVIVQADKLIAELKPITATNKQRRRFGLCAGEFKVPDDFDAPLPEAILNAFEADENSYRYPFLFMVYQW